MNQQPRYTRDTVPPVSPRQARPNMVLKAFRFPPALWERVEAICAEEGINPSDAVREAVAQWEQRKR